MNGCIPIRTSSGSQASRSLAERCLIPHSQITMTRQPSAANDSRLRLSRSMLASNFCCQNSWRVAGVVASLQFACRCQKHPCTKMQSRCFGSTMSGVPGKRRSLSTYRSPALCRTFRMKISGLVFFPPIPAIHLDRVALSTMSLKDVLRAIGPASQL